jgi:surface carbohydrate biosynthesis protein (TIGR04326 family)
MLKFNKIKIIDNTCKDELDPNYYHIYWDQLKSSTNGLSINSYIDQHKVELRDEYLDLIYKIANFTFDGKSLIDRVTLKNKFSLWWISLINEKCNISKSPEVNDSIKLLALNRLLLSSEISSITYLGSNNNLLALLRNFTKNKKIKFTAKNFYYVNIHFNIIKSLVSFARLFILSYIFNARVKIKNLQVNYQYCFVGYLFPSDFDKYKSERYCGAQWGDLPSLIEDKKSLWVHIPINLDCFLDMNVVRMLKKIRNSSFNRNHITIFNEASFKIFFKTICQFFYAIYVSAVYRRRISLGFYDVNIIYSLNKSFYGSNALATLYYSNLIEALSKRLVKVEKTIYLQEGQSWESSLNFFFKKNLKSKMIGYTHSAVRFWDLKNFQSKKYLTSVESFIYVNPDIVCVNSFYAYDLLKMAGFHKNVMPVEALRFSYLSENFLANNVKNKVVRLLVVADGVERYCLQQMDIVKSFLENYGCNIKIIVKAHPAFPMSFDDNIEVTSDSIESLLKTANIVLVGPTTTVAAEAYSLGVPVVTIKDESTLNFSPLYGIDGVKFISTAHELNSIVREFVAMGYGNHVPQPYFYIDTNYRKWAGILEVKLDDVQ